MHAEDTDFTKPILKTSKLNLLFFYKGDATQFMIMLVNILVIVHCSDISNTSMR